MNFILDVPKEKWPLFECDRTGRPKIYATNAIVQLAQNQDAYDFKDKTRLNFCYLVAVGLTIPQSSPQKINSSLTAATAAVQSTLKLNIRDETDIAVENLPITKISEANSNGFLWQGWQGVANIAESTLICTNAASVSDNTAVELHFHYLKFAKGSSYRNSAI